MHAVAQAWEEGRSFHIDLNEQYPGHNDQYLRFCSPDIKAAFYLGKFLEKMDYDSPRHFDTYS